MCSGIGAPRIKAHLIGYAASRGEADIAGVVTCDEVIVLDLQMDKAPLRQDDAMQQNMPDELAPGHTA